MLMLSTLVYAGGVSLVLGAIGLVTPGRWRRVGSRWRALGAVAAGVLCWAVALKWPTPTLQVASVASAIDEAMPAYQFVEHHETTVRARPEDVIRAINEVTARDIRYFRLLTWIRNPHIRRTRESILAAPPDKPLLGVALARGFVELPGRPDREIVVGVRVATAVRAVMNFAVHPDGQGGSLLSTETRVLAENTAGLRSFTMYWRVIYPGSALIRVEWLRAIKRRAEIQSSGDD
jgi:hypothetical protein